jgi:phosphatidylglycerol:prolipoprotein diacylglycerol transferase
LNGCCLGKPFAGVFATRDGAGTMRWPAPAVEGAFQIVMLITVLLLQRRGLLRDRLFFLYLAAYGLFRFLHEFMRDTPKIVAGLSGYQLIALGMAVLGGVMMCRRTKSMLAPAVAEGSLRP